jgi:DUF4097 and DUF4098 domain-containing protein YvlB
MKNQRRNAALLSLAILATSCGVAGERYEAKINKTWPAASVRSVEVDEVNGSVTVEASSGSEITLVAEVSARGIAPKKDVENSGYFTARVEGDTLHIARTKHSKHIQFHFFDGDQVTINYKLQVPATVALDLETVNGRIATHGISGATQLETVNGTIDVETPGTSELNARTVNGKVRAKFMDSFQGATLKTVNGEIEARLPASASFSCDLSQVNGDFEAGFPLAIHSNPGSRRVSGEVNGGRYQLKITTVNGDVEVAHSSLPPAPAAPPAPPAPPATSGTSSGTI